MSNKNLNTLNVKTLNYTGDYIYHRGVPVEIGGGGGGGAKGVKGDQGFQGIQGVQGVQGDPGVQGDKGATGPKGDTVDGDKGNKGDTGPKGAVVGDKGNKGDTGPKGDQGGQGIQGNKGDTGPKGDQGGQGIQGNKGDTGPKGTSLWTSNGNDIYNNNSGNVGIKTDTPTQTLDVSGNTRLRGDLFDATDSSGAIGDVLQPTPTGVQWTTNPTHHGSVPMGTIVMWGLPAIIPPPANWFLCTGLLVDSTIYPTFYAALSTTYGPAGTLPDFRGRFPAMAGNPGTVDPSGYIDILGSSTDISHIPMDQIPGHRHDIITHWGGGSGMESATSATNYFNSYNGGVGTPLSILGTGSTQEVKHYIGFGGSGTLAEPFLGTENTSTSQGGVTGRGNAYAPPHLSINFIIYAGPPG